MSPQAQHEAEQILCLPIAASSVLASASGHLQSSQKWREMATHQSIGTCFHALMAIVIPRQPLLLFKVLMAQVVTYADFVKRAQVHAIKAHDCDDAQVHAIR